MQIRGEQSRPLVTGVAQTAHGAVGCTCKNAPRRLSIYAHEPRAAAESGDLQAMESGRIRMGATAGHTLDVVQTLDFANTKGPITL